MYHKVMVMEVKEHYALAMGEDGQIVRIRYKAGMQIGDCIYILEEDLYQEEKTEYPEHPALVPFETKKEKAKKLYPVLETDHSSSCRSCIVYSFVYLGYEAGNRLCHGHS